ARAGRRSAGPPRYGPGRGWARRPGSPRWSPSWWRSGSDGGHAMALGVSERQEAILVASVLIAAIAGLYASTLVLQPVPVQASEVHLVRLDVESVGWSIQYAPMTTD